MTQDNRELLEMAAKAIGMTLRYNYLGGRDANQPWDPLEDDGDALRLGVRLKINLFLGEAEYVTAGRSGISGHRVPVGYDADAAVRFAILCVAADIGRAMP